MLSFCLYSEVISKNLTELSLFELESISQGFSFNFSWMENVRFPMILVAILVVFLI